MRHIRIAEQTLKLGAEPSRRYYICRTCLVAQTARQIHTSVPRAAEIPFFQRFRDTLFGSKKSKQAEAAAEKARKQRLEEVKGNPQAVLRTKSFYKAGKKYQLAAEVDPSIQQGYVQASTWHGLKRVGSEEWVKARNDQGEQYVGFLRKRPLKLDDDQWRRLLHHTAVEVLVLEKAGRDILEVCGPRSQRTAGLTCKVKISQDGGNASLTFPSEDMEKMILDAILPSELGERAEQLPIGSEIQQMIAREPSAYEQGKSTSPSWISVKVPNEAIKFAMLKRIMILTGCRVPDSGTSRSSTLGDLFQALKTKEKPKALYLTSELQDLKANDEFPNISVHSRRRTPVHKEMDIGRWKLIEEELIARDLPVFGSRHREAKERLAPM